jgi:hypothetical protein
MSKIDNDDRLIEKLAEAAHEVFCEEMRKQGYVYGLVTDESKKQHSSLLPFSKLPEDEKEQNRDTVRDIPSKLAYLGYGLRPKQDNELSIEFSKVDIEKLAEKEHRRWVKQKLAAGWQYGSRTDKTRKIHQDIVPWDKLTENDKEKDRVMIRAIPKIVSKAGYTMAKKT